MNQVPATIVIVDDEPDTAAMMCDFFDLLGLHAVHCPPGSQTAACISQHQPTVIILDVLFDSSMNGIDLLHQLRAAPTTQAVPIVFFSGSEDHLQQLLPMNTTRRCDVGCLLVEPSMSSHLPPLEGHECWSRSPVLNARMTTN